MSLSLINPASISTAWFWLCTQRRKFPASDDIWHLRFFKSHRLPIIVTMIQHQRFRFSPPQRIIKADGTSIILWSATDSLVQKLLTIVLQNILPTNINCTHLKGHGGHKFTVRKVNQWIQSGDYKFVCRTDIRGYYANINKYQLLEQLAQFVHNPIMLNLLAQFVFYTVEYGGTFHTPKKGISRGSPLSPLLAGFQLYEVDKHFSQQRHCKYDRHGWWKCRFCRSENRPCVSWMISLSSAKLDITCVKQ